MGHRHTKEEILSGAVDAAFADGLSQLTYGRVAKRLGINDRTVVYYFPSKDDILLSFVEDELQTLTDRMKEIEKQDLGAMPKLRQMLFVKNYINCIFGIKM